MAEDLTPTGKKKASVTERGRLKVGGQFASLPDAGGAKVQEMYEEEKKANTEARLANEAAQQIMRGEGKNTEKLLKLAIERKVAETEKERAEEIQTKFIEKQAKIQMGEYGFRALFDNGRKQLESFLMMDKTFSEGLGELGDALKNDLQFVGQMLSPLTAIPGVNTALTGLKFLGGNLLKLATKEGREQAKHWIMEKKQWAWEKIQAAKEKIKARASMLKEDGVGGTAKKAGKAAKNAFMKLLQGFGVAILGVVAFVVSFGREFTQSLKALLARPFQAVKNLFKGFKLPKPITTAINAIKGFFTTRPGATGGLGGIFAKIRSLLTPVTTAVSKLMQSPVVRFMGKLGGILGRFFAPVTLLMGVWNGVKGLIAGFQQTEGSFMDKIIGGLGGMVEKLVNFFIMMPLDLIKDLLAWIGEKLGLIGPDTKKAINDFSFQELFSSLWESLMNIGLGVVNFAKAVGFGAWAAVKAAWPGGESPMEAFTRVYDETMASGQGVYTTVSESGVSAEDIDEGAEANKREEDMKESERAAGMQNGGNTNVAAQTTNVNQAGKTIQLRMNGPSDTSSVRGAMAHG